MYSKPSISRLETREVYSWSSAAALPETQHDQHNVTLIDKSSWIPKNITGMSLKFNSLSNHKNHFPDYYKLCKSSPPHHYYYSLFISSKWSALRYELKKLTQILHEWYLEKGEKKKSKVTRTFWKRTKKHPQLWSPVVKVETPVSSAS